MNETHEELVMEVDKLLKVKNIGAWNRRFLHKVDIQLLRQRPLTLKQKLILRKIGEEYGRMQMRSKM